MKTTLDNNDAFVIDLNVKKDFSNDNLFDNIKYDSISNSNNKFNYDVKIPDYIKNNFKYDEKEETYYKETNSTKEEYFTDILNKSTDVGIEHFEYSFIDKSISYYILKENDIISNSFRYNLSLEKCNYGKCDNTLINDFIQNYVEKYNFN